MSIRCCAMVLAMAAACHGCATAAIEPLSSEARISSSRTACVWTGKEMIVWSGTRQVLALDPEKNVWRPVTTDPYPGRVLQQELLRLSDGSILAAYWVIGKKTRLCFDRYHPDTGRWRRMAFVNLEDFNNPEGKPYENFRYTLGNKEHVAFALEIGGLAALADGAVVFVASNWSGDPVMGVRVAGDGAVKFISRKGACPKSYTPEDTAVYASGGKVLYFGYADVARNMWAVWDEKADAWSPPQEARERYSFAHCQAGDEVYVIGGAESASGWIIRDGEIYSFKENRWRPLPEDGGPPGRRDHVMCWTGELALVWGGRVLGFDVMEIRDEGAAKAPFNAVLGFDPRTGRWRVLPGQDAPQARASCTSVWTGKEMIVWSGWPGQADHFGYAYNPQLGRWRKLPAPP